MKLEILHVPDCPNTGVLMTRLDLAGRGPVEVELHAIHDHDGAATSGMTGSPTLLIDGLDPFAVAGQSPSMTCRLYVDEIGTVSGAPSVAQLRAVLATDGH